MANTSRHVVRGYDVVTIGVGEPPDGWEPPERYDGVQVVGRGTVQLSSWLPGDFRDMRVLVSRDASVVEWTEGLLTSLEVLELGSAAQRKRGYSVSTALRSLALNDVPVWADSWADAELEELYLSRFTGTGTRVFEGLDRLGSLKLSGAGQELTFDWDRPPARLTNFLSGSIRLAALEGLALPSLERFEAYLARPIDDRELDVSPFAQCPRLRWADVCRQGRLVGLGALDQLSDLRFFLVRTGYYDAADARSHAIEEKEIASARPR